MYRLSILFAVAASLAPAQDQLPDGPGKEAVLKVCAGCHGPNIILGRGHSKDQWVQIVTDMAQRGAQGEEGEFADVVDYLAKYFPPSAMKKVNVNKASADELKLALGTAVKDAAEIVKYREKNGDFKTLEDLKKVGGVDAAKLDAKKSRLTF